MPPLENLDFGVIFNRSNQSMIIISGLTFGIGRLSLVTLLKLNSGASTKTNVR